MTAAYPSHEFVRNLASDLYADYFRPAFYGLIILAENLADQFITQKQDTYRKILRMSGAQSQ